MMYLSYSGFKAYTSCPRMYWHQYIAKTKLEVPDNKVNSLFGTLVGGLFETFYSERLWRETHIEQKLQDLVLPHYIRMVANETRTGAIRWKPEDPKAKYTDPEALLVDARETIPRGLAIIRQYRLLGPTQSEAEVKLDCVVDGHIIGGRADFLIRRIAPHRDLVLIDGKGSEWRDKYVDPRQLHWYALLHRLKYGISVDKLGFVFWRSPPETALDWVPFTEEHLAELQASILGAITQIDEAKTRLRLAPVDAQMALLNEMFLVSPGDRCRLCTYMVVCPDGNQFLNAQVPTLACVGVEDVGFNG